MNGPGYTNPGAPPNDVAQNFSTPAGSYYNYATSCGLTGTPYQYCAPPVSNLDTWGLSNVLNVDFGHGFSLKSISAERYVHQASRPTKTARRWPG